MRVWWVRVWWVALVCTVSVMGPTVQSSGFRHSGVGLRHWSVWDVWGLGLRVWGLELRVEGRGSRVEGL